MRHLLWLALLVGACVDKGPGDQGRQIDPGYIQDHLMETPPAALVHRVDAHFADAVIYLGNDLATTTVIPGDKVVVNHYWQVITPPGAQWRVFSHLRGPAGDFLNVDLTDMRTGHPPAKWQAGQIIRDEQSFVLDKAWKSPTANLVVGLYQKGKHTIEDRMLITGGEVQDDRSVIVLKMAVDLAKAPPPPGNLLVKKAIGPITIDGKADDPGWRDAVVQTSFTSAEGCSELVDGTSAKMTWDDQYLYFFVSAEDADVHSDYTNHDDHLWDQDVIEVFIDADGNKRGYVELQTNPRNVHFDTWLAAGRNPRDDSFTAGLVSQVVVRGTLDNRGDGDAGWDLELAIPVAAVRGNDAKMKVNVPPRPGDVWRLNVVRSDKDAKGVQRAASWNRIGCDDFHAVDRMLNVQFADSAGAVTPPTPEAPLQLADTDAGVPPVKPAPAQDDDAGPPTRSKVTPRPPRTGSGIGAP